MDPVNIQAIRDNIMAVNLLSEIPEKKRTEAQTKALDDAQNELTTYALDVFDTVTKPVFDEIKFILACEGDQNMFVRWGQIMDSPDCRPPRMDNGTPNPGEFENMFRKLYSGHNSVAGVYEEAKAYKENFDLAMAYAEKVCTATWNFEKITKARNLFDSQIPNDIEQAIRRISEYVERAKERIKDYDYAFNALVQLKNINLGTPNQPYRMTESNTGNGEVRESRPQRDPSASVFSGRGTGRS